MKHTSRGSGPSVFNGFEGRVRHTLASHPGPFWATSWARILLGLISLFRMHRAAEGAVIVSVYRLDEAYQPRLRS